MQIICSEAHPNIIAGDYSKKVNNTFQVLLEVIKAEHKQDAKTRQDFVERYQPGLE
jgi:hypothetical protein